MFESRRSDQFFNDLAGFLEISSSTAVLETVLIMSHLTPSHI